MGCGCVFAPLFPRSKSLALRSLRSFRMLYLKSETELEEVISLYKTFNIELPYFAAPQLDAESRLYFSGEELEGEPGFFVNPKTAMWCYLNEEEKRLVHLLQVEKTFSEIQQEVRSLSPEKIREFLTHLYQRGLLRVDGKIGIDEHIYDRGPLFYRKYLIELLITEKCNLACRYCFADAG